MRLWYVDDDVDTILPRRGVGGPPVEDVAERRDADNHSALPDGDEKG